MKNVNVRRMAITIDRVMMVYSISRLTVIAAMVMTVIVSDSGTISLLKKGVCRILGIRDTLFVESNWSDIGSRLSYFYSGFDQSQQLIRERFPAFVAILIYQVLIVIDVLSCDLLQRIVDDR